MLEWVLVTSLRSTEVWFGDFLHELIIYILVVF